MEDKLAVAEKNVLIGIVKLVQRRGMSGTSGDWKEFLKSHDKKFGSSISDPAKRSNEDIVSFLKTFDKDEDVKFIEKVLQGHSNYSTRKQFMQDSTENESAEYKLIRSTIEHPLYALDYMLPSHEQGWMVTALNKKAKVKRSNKIVALDCEMVQCEDGTEGLVRVCAVGRNLEVKLDKLVKPDKAITDYRTDITGITKKTLEGVTCTLADIQKSLKKIVSNRTILAGHSLHNDLKVLKIDHPWVIDTSFIFKYSARPLGKRPSLNNLCKSVLGYELRKPGAPHNCKDDACAAMKLTLAKIEHGVDKDVPVVQADVPETEMAKLFVHNIPASLSSEELHKVIPGDFTLEVKQCKRAQNEKYSALAIFKNSQEALLAFENVKGNLEQDTSGRPQKLVELKLNKDQPISFYVRKMGSGNPLGEISGQKRALESHEDSNDHKKVKTTQENKDEIMAYLNEKSDKLEQATNLSGEVLKECTQNKVSDDHLTEIQKLKEELKSKDICLAEKDQTINELRKNLDKAKKLLSLSLE
ncbi:hypothetical protein ACFE04_003045 [Oxalis oulophora]